MPETLQNRKNTSIKLKLLTLTYSIDKIKIATSLFVAVLFHLGLETLYAQSMEESWVDSVFQSLTPTERLGQLFMIRAHSDLGDDHIAFVKKQIKEYGVGGLCFFQGTPSKQAKLTNTYQTLSKVPLMVAVDAEWGPGMRFKEHAMNFPRQLTLGAIQDNRLIYEMGKEIARQLLRMGVNVNFAPVVDINNNVNNPVINDRSFGEDRYNVTAKGYMYMKGMQDEGVIACAKHFPGHGDTDVDSHSDLPIIAHSRQRLDSIEFYPFQSLADRGIQSMMVAHLHIPAIDPQSNVPTTLSEKTVKGLLKKEMGFQGLVFTDGLEMKGVTKHYPEGETEALALKAGNDILLLPQNIEASFKYIQEYLTSGKLSQAEIDRSVKKVLATKYRMGLHRLAPVELANLDADLFPQRAHALKRRLYEKSITLVNNQDKIIPIEDLNISKAATLALGATKLTDFQKRVASYIPVKHHNFGMNISDTDQKSIAESLVESELVFISLHGMNKYASKQFGLTQEAIELVRDLSLQTQVVLVVFGSPYSLQFFDQQHSLVCAYQDETLAQEMAAQQIFGAYTFSGRLPVSASDKLTFQRGFITRNLMRLGYSNPSEVGMNSDTLAKIAEVVQELIDNRSAPGCQILVAKNNKIVYQEAFGTHEYGSKKKVSRTDLYDVASITKVAAATLAIMKLSETKKIDIKKPIAFYLPELRNTNKGSITIEEILAHHGRLIGWIPFYKSTLVGSFRNPRPDPKIYRPVKSGKHVVPVAKNLFMDKQYLDTIWHKIEVSDLRSTKGYRYSDLGFYLISKIVKRITDQELDQYCDQNFYRPLGLISTEFNPWARRPLNQVVPSEEDTYFRRQKVHGYVHDMGAAMLGGVSGHAGLFTNAYELAVLFQMLLNNGIYGGRTYLRESTIDRFTTRYVYSSRRGIGFDMKELNPGKTQNTAEASSIFTFGHTGFTGTCVWADPDQNLIFVFLSNRTYPSMRNNLLHKNNYRTRLQSLVYNALKSPVS